MSSIETIELKPDESMVTEEGRTNRVLRLGPVDLAFYGDKKREPWIDANEYRIAQALAVDLASIRSMGGGNHLARYGDESFVAVPGAGRHRYGLDNPAAGREADAKAAVGADVAWAILREWADDGFYPTELGARWKYSRATIRKTIHMCLERIDAAEVYEQRKWDSSRIFAPAA